MGKLVSNYGFINHLTNIDYCELAAIHACLNDTINDCNIINNGKYKYITILTDSMFCLYLMDERYYCKIQYYYDLLQLIFILCNKIKEYGKIVRIVKIPAHKGHTGNEIADFWAKYGAETAIEMDKDGDISNSDVPLIVQKEINDRKVEKYYYENRDEEREQKRDDARNEGRLRVNSNLIAMMKRKGSKHVKNELKRLNRKEAAIIFQLRSEHIELNLYNSVWDHAIDPNCDTCGTLETVKHYLIDCERFEVQRLQLRMELIKINKRFEKDKHFNIICILFPHVFQGKPYRDRQIDDRIKILKLVCDYVLQTKRFADAKSNVFKMKRRDNYYKMHNSYHVASLMVLNNFNTRNCVNGELVHEDDMDFEVLECEDDDFNDFEDLENLSGNENDVKDDLNQEYNYESFVFDRGR